MNGGGSIKTYILNLVLLVICGTLLLFWVWYYTDQLPIVGGLLSLGGVLAWIPFLLNLLSDDRKKQLQALFESKVLDRAWLSFVMGLSLLVLAAVSVGHGTIALDSIADDQVRNLTIEPVEDNSAAVATDVDRRLVLPRADSKHVLSTPLLGTRGYRVKLSGLPALTVNIGFLQKTTLRVPESFVVRTCLLIRPEMVMSATLRSAPQEDPYALRVSVPGRGVDSLRPYTGGSVWVGCESDVPIPASVIDQWHGTLLLQGINSELVSVAMARWNNTAAVLSGLELRSGDTVHVTVIKGVRHTVSDTTVVVRPVASLVQGCQEVLLD